MSVLFLNRNDACFPFDWMMRQCFPFFCVDENLFVGFHFVPVLFLSSYVFGHVADGHVQYIRNKLGLLESWGKSDFSLEMSRLLSSAHNDTSPICCVHKSLSAAFDNRRPCKYEAEGCRTLLLDLTTQNSCEIRRKKADHTSNQLFFAVCRAGSASFNCHPYLTYV